MSNSENSKKPKHSKGYSINKNFLRVAIPALIVVVIGVVLFITTPWQKGVEPSPSADPETPPPTVIETPEPTPEETALPPIETPTPPPETPTPHLSWGEYNPLTGEAWDEDLSDSRPWAMSIGNTAAAMPLWGVGKADIILEFVVDESATRIIAIFQDISDLDRTGGLRSLRTSSLELTQSFDAIFVHWGGRTYDNEVPGGLATQFGTIDASGIGYRDPDRVTKPALEHRAVITGDRLLRGVPSSFRTEHETGFRHSFTFGEGDVIPDGLAANDVLVNFHSYINKTTQFTYNSSENVYYATQHGAPFIDGNDNEKLSFANIIVINTTMKPVKPNPSTAHTKVNTNGNGTGYFISGGKYVEITWQRTSGTSPFRFYLADGTPLVMGVGKTYICVVDDKQVPTFS